MRAYGLCPGAAHFFWVAIQAVHACLCHFFAVTEAMHLFDELCDKQRMTLGVTLLSGSLVLTKAAA